MVREDLVAWFIRELKGNTQDKRLLTIRRLNEIGASYFPLFDPGGGNYASSFKTTALTMWALLVGPGRPWDCKVHLGRIVGNDPYTDYGGIDYFYDVWGNINYGYAGRAAGFGRDELLEGAGFGQILSDLRSDQRPNYTASTNWADPADQAGVRIGINLYDQYGLIIDKVKFRQTFQSEVSNLRIRQ